MRVARINDVSWPINFGSSIKKGGESIFTIHRSSLTIMKIAVLLATLAIVGSLSYLSFTGQQSTEASDQETLEEARVISEKLVAGMIGVVSATN